MISILMIYLAFLAGTVYSWKKTLLGKSIFYR